MRGSERSCKILRMAQNWTFGTLASGAAVSRIVSNRRPAFEAGRWFEVSAPIAACLMHRLTLVR